MASPTTRSSRTRTTGLVILLAGMLAGLGWQLFGNDPAPRPRATPAIVKPAPDKALPTAASQAAKTPAASREAVVEVAPATEEAPFLGELRESYGHRAGLHKAKDDLRLSASAALVIDQDTGKVLFRKNEQAVLPIASLTKLMTALIVTEARLPLDETITITEEDVDAERHSRSRLRVGTALSRGEALHVALMSSENRAAHALGRTSPSGSAAFVKAMNRKAAALGMKSTTFVDPTGLSNRNQSTAQDLSILAAAAARNPQLAEFSTTPQHQLALDGRRILQYNNSNRLVKSPKWDISLQKTGYIIEAGWCVLMHTRVAGQNLQVVLLDAAGKGSRTADAERIKRWIGAQAQGRAFKS